MAAESLQVGPMQTDLDRVRFAVSFRNAQRPMAMKEEELSGLREEVTAFLGYSSEAGEPTGDFGIRVAVLQEPWPMQLSRSRLDQLHKSVRRLLGDTLTKRKARVIIDGRESRQIHEGGGILPTSLTEGDDGQPIRVAVTGPADDRTLVIGGSARVGFLLTLAFLMASPAGRRVLECPECGRLFVREGRQKYCQPSCTEKANSWERLPEEKKREYRKRQYEQHGWTLGARSKGQDEDEQSGDNDG